MLLVALVWTSTFVSSGSGQDLDAVGDADEVIDWYGPDYGARTLLRWSNQTDDGPPERFGKFKDEILVTDRPDFTEASTTVGRGAVQLEFGYTYEYDNEHGTRLTGHSVGEPLLRIGMLADWFELRIGANYLFERADEGATIEDLDAFEDLYLGLKLALTEQEGILPEMALIPQMTVPTGSPFTAGQVQAGVNWVYSWELTDSVSIAGSTQINRSRSGSPEFRGVPDSALFAQVGMGQEFFMEFAQSMTAVVSLTEKLGSYFEWFAFVPIGADEPQVASEQFFNGGFAYLVTNNLQLDIRAGVGLNDSANDLFAGAGASVRF